MPSSNFHFGEHYKGGVGTRPYAGTNYELSMYYEQDAECQFVGAASKPARFSSKLELLMPSVAFDTPLIAGMDEVGRGCIAGSVVAAIVILQPDIEIEGLDDSKQLSPMRRESLSLQIKQSSLAWAIGRAEPGEIDRINILQATLLAMRRAYDALPVKPGWVKVDGNRFPNIPCKGEAIIGGDACVPQISAASILAKVFRDREMAIIDALYPGYRFADHKGYPTQAHKAKLKELGATPIHRLSFAPVSRVLPIGNNK